MDFPAKGTRWITEFAVSLIESLGLRWRGDHRGWPRL